MSRSLIGGDAGYDRRQRGQRMAEGAPRPFKLHVGDELLNQTKKKLESARFPDDIADGWEDGTPSSEVRRLRDFWLKSYDWRSEETRINNELPQYKQAVNVTGWGSLDIHFVHKRSSRPGALPLIFIHGCNFQLGYNRSHLSRARPFSGGSKNLTAAYRTGNSGRPSISRNVPKSF
jgi:Epoxide hydrolase N terminus